MNYGFSRAARGATTRRMRAYRPLGWALLPMAMVSAAPAVAQNAPLLQSEIPLSYDRGRNTSVLERERPEYESLGVPLGSFYLQPRVETSIGYSSNVFGLSEDKVGDAFVEVDPSVRLESNWSSHALTLNGGARFLRFAEQTSRNESGLNASFDGRLDVTQGIRLFSGAGIQRGFEQTSSAGFPGDAIEPVEYIAKTAYVRAERSGTRLRLAGLIDVTDLNFRDVRTFDSGLLDQDFRDRVTLRGAVQAEYGLTPDTSVYTQVSLTRADYDQSFAFGLANRDSDKLRGLVGASFDLAALARGRVAIGYQRQTFEAPIYDDFGGLAAEARLELFPSQLTTVTLGARRFIEESVIAGSEAYFANGVSAAVDHELLRNLLLNARVDYERDIFRSITRRDTVKQASVGARYFATRNWGVAANATYLDRDSTGVFQGPNFNEFRGTLSLVLQR